jgi:hypothetical protein
MTLRRGLTWLWLTSVAASAVVTRPAQAQDVATDAAAPEGSTRYGVGVRAPRWITVPSWVLGLFATENVPLSTFGSYGVELIARRPAGYDIVLGIGYQNMSPADGNWLGRGKDPSFDTDFVQPRGVALLGADISVISRRMLTRYFGVHYGGGLGLAQVRGEVKRISNSTACNAQNAGNERLCRPVVCPPNGCSESQLQATETGPDGGSTMPHRFKDQDIPGAFPIVNLTLGFDLRLPEVPGFEARLEGGFYDGFFLGSSFAYIF